MTFLHILAVIFVLALLIAFHEFGHFICAKSLGVPVKIYSIGFPLGNMKPLISIKWGETDCQLNPLPLGGFCAFMDDDRSEESEEAEEDKDENELYDENDPRFLKNRKIWERAIIISGGVIANTIIAYVVLVGLVFFNGVPVQDKSTGVVIGEVIAGEPASEAGFQAGDKVLSINNHPIQVSEDMQKIVKEYKGQTITVIIERQGKTITLNPVPSTEEGTIGVRIGEMVSHRPIQNIGEPFVQGAVDLKNMFALLTKALADLVTGVIPIHQVGGLVEVVNIGAKVAQTGLIQLLYFTALISVELAILNVLPIPALDGGHLFLLIIEALRGRPLPRNVEQNLHYAGFMILIGLGVLLIFKDIWGLMLGKG